VRKGVTAPLTQNQFDALVCFAFNVGNGALLSSTLLRELNKRDYAAAANQFLRWNKAGGHELPGLTRRREAERRLFLATSNGGHGYRCSQCNTNWPSGSDYKQCPFCETDTWPISDADSVLTYAEAEQLLAKHQAQYQAAADLERRLDDAFDGMFCRENGIANPFGLDAVLADVTHNKAPLCECINVFMP
jgi:hypothetical protein